MQEFNLKYKNMNACQYRKSIPVSRINSHLYNYCSNNPIKYVDPNGFAHFGKRPMKIFHNYWGIFASNPIDNIANTELCHEQLFYDDEKGGNLGFSWDGLFEEPNAEYKNII